MVVNDNSEGLLLDCLCVDYGLDVGQNVILESEDCLRVRLNRGKDTLNLLEEGVVVELVTALGSHIRIVSCRNNAFVIGFQSRTLLVILTFNETFKIGNTSTIFVKDG